MEKPSLKKYWEANCSSQRERVIEEAFALIDKLEKQLLIQRVSQQRELLNAFTEKCNRYRTTMEEITPEEIDKFMDSI